MLTFSGALEQSCNDALMQIAMAMGKESFCHYQNVFNFGLRTTIDLPGEALTSSLIYNVENMGPGAISGITYNLSIEDSAIKRLVKSEIEKIKNAA